MRYKTQQTKRRRKKRWVLISKSNGSFKTCAVLVKVGGSTLKHPTSNLSQQEIIADIPACAPAESSHRTPLCLTLSPGNRGARDCTLGVIWNLDLEEHLRKTYSDERRIFKNAPEVLRYLWKLMKVAWQKGVIPKAWRRAGGILIPKEKDSAAIGQFRQISLLNVEGKIFFKVLAQRLSTYLQRNNFIDTSVQKAGIQGFSGCMEHANMIWHQIQSAKKERRDLHVIFLDLANAFGSVPHGILWTAFNYFGIPDHVTGLVKNYFQDLQFCITVGNATTAWQQLETGIMAGCTISPLAFVMAMELIIRASRWVVGGKLTDERFYISEEPIPTVLEKPIKSLGRWYNAEIKDTQQFEQIRQDLANRLKKINNTALPGKLKLWCYQFGLLPRLLWPLTMYEVSLSHANLMERLVNTYVRKWLGLPKCVSSVSLYSKGALLLPISSLVEEFKCAKVRLDMSLTESRDPTKASATERRTLVVEEVRRQEEAVRCSKAVAQAKQGRWMRWEGVKRKKLTWSELCDMESN
ncbi:hypothetical protein QQF64_001613 [Cirrhinus molitorella]|uniref:Reverse transcriptase domain-containing protein n=1 Tax=Cirrhinus molitorella TaxID=172907 RepID=A0ABR3P0K3_9TELE